MSIIESQMSILSGIQYKGFDTKQTRDDFKASGAIFPELVLLLGAFATVANNPARLTISVRDESMGKKVKKLMQDRGVGAERSGGLTLSRLAHAFAPVHLAVRRMMLSRGILRMPQMVTSSPPEYCDLAFNGLYSEAADFCLKMGRIITKVSQPKLTDDECDQKTVQFAGIARSGLSGDKLLSDTLGVTDEVRLMAFTGLTPAKP